MQKLSNIKLISLVGNLLILVLIAKVIALVVWWFLPSEGVELNAKKSYQAKYQRVSFTNMLVRAKVEEKAVVQEVKNTTKAYSINNLLLKGLYGSKFSGFAIVAKQSSAKNTTLVEVGEVYEGYKLKEINLHNVIFSKNAKDYMLELDASKTKVSDLVRKVKRKNSLPSDDYETQKEVTREDINSYAKNPSKIWKDISIAPVKKAGKITGFKVNRIKKGSKMATLGLQKGDIIIKANNVRLASFNDAIKLYKNINKIDTLALTVERNHEEKEIIYEIR